MAFCVCIFGPFILPMITVILPCDHQLLSRFICSDIETCRVDKGPCSYWIIKLFIYISEIISFLPCFAFGAPLVSSCLLSLSNLLKCLKSIQYINKRPFKTLSCYLKLAKFYIKLQVFAVLTNQSFQLFVPLAQFAGSGWTIMCLYSTIQYNKQLPVYLNIFIMEFAIIVLLVVVSLMDWASKTIVFSRKVITPWMKLCRCKEYNDFKYVTRSLRLIKIQSGSFNAITKNTTATFIRFCLQRTIFLVMWTRTVLQHE